MWVYSAFLEADALIQSTFQVPQNPGCCCVCFPSRLCDATLDTLKEMSGLVFTESHINPPTTTWRLCACSEAPFASQLPFTAPGVCDGLQSEYPSLSKRAEVYLD